MEVDRPDHRRPPAKRGRRRATDRVEDAAAWVLMALALTTVLGAILVGGAGYSETLDRVRIENAERTAVRAVLAESATRRGPQQVKATWTGSDGTPVSGQVPVRDQRPAGAEVQVWLDARGHVAGAPMEVGAAVVVAWVRAVLSALCGWSLLALAWVGVRRAVAARNAAAWEREWARVEPSWSGRTTT